MSAVSEWIARWRKSISGLEKIVADHESGRTTLEPEKAESAKHALRQLKTMIESIEKKHDA